MKNFFKTSLKRICYGVRNVLDPFFHYHEIAILAYHSISDTHIDTAVSPQDFAEQLRYLQKKGFTFISLDAIVAWAKSSAEKEIPLISRKVVAVTFDDGYADFETVALPVLERLSVPVTLFVIGKSIEGGVLRHDSQEEKDIRKNLENTLPLLTPEAFDRLRSHELVSFGYHSLTHANLAKLSGEALQKEIKSGLPARYFAYPGGNYSDEAISEVEKAGYEAAFSIKRHLVKKFAKPSDRYLIPRTVVTKDMKPWEVGMHVTQAIEWYRALTNWVQ